MRFWILLLTVMLISACSPTANDDVIDFDFELQSLSTEAATIREDMVIAQTVIAATIDGAVLQSENFNRYNDALRATALAIFPPTSEARIVANDLDGPLPPEVYDLSNGEMRFVQIGPAGEIDDNNCFRAKQQFFRPSQGVVYMTAVALNLRAGTTVRADWQYLGDLVYTNSWVAPQSEQYRCISLAMRTSDVEFFLGNWSVTLSVNGNPTEPKSFTIFDG